MDWGGKAYKRHMLAAGCLFIGSGVGAVGAIVHAQEAYRCDTAEGVVYQATPCRGSVTGRVIRFSDHDKGVQLAEQEVMHLADSLAEDRRARHLVAQKRGLHQALERLAQAYQADREEPATQRAGLASAPAFRNWQTNPVRRAKYEASKRDLEEAAKALNRSYELERSRLSSALARVDADAQAQRSH